MFESVQEGPTIHDGIVAADAGEDVVDGCERALCGRHVATHLGQNGQDACQPQERALATHVGTSEQHERRAAPAQREAVAGDAPGGGGASCGA